MVSLNCCPPALPYGRRVVLIFAGAALLLGSPGYVLTAGAPSAVSETKPELKTVVIPVEGMACVACAARIKKAVKSLDGVSYVEVSLEKRTAQVTYAAHKLTPDRIVAAIDELGYKAGTPEEVE